MLNLINGDCLEEMDRLQKESLDLILTDPPYGMSFQSNYRKEKYNSIVNDNNLDWLDEFVDKAYGLLKNDRHAYFFCSWHNVDKFKQSLEKKFNVKNILIWEKNNTGMGDLKGDYAPQYEMIIYCQKGHRELNNGRHSNILKFNKTKNEYHPTEKPVNMLEFLIKKSTNKNESVGDFFSGSGSTLIASINTERNCIGIELDNGYYNISKKRVDIAKKNYQPELFY